MADAAVAESTPTSNDGIDDSRFHGSVSYVAEDPKPAVETPAPDAKADETKTAPKADDRARDEKGQFVKKEEKSEKVEKTEATPSKLPESLRPPKPKDPTDINARFHDLSRNHDDLKRQLQEAQREIQSLRTPKTDTTKTEAQPQKSYSGKPRPKSEDFNTYDEYTEALTDWKVEEAAAKQKAEQGQADAQRTYTEREQSFFTHAAPIIAEVPNFEQILRDPNNAMSDNMYHGLMNLGEIGPYAALYLALNQDQARAMYKLGPEETLLALGRLAQRCEVEIQKANMAEEQAAATQPGATTVATPAPAKTRTIPDIKGTTPTTGDLDTEPQDDDPIETWRAKEGNRMAKKFPGQRFFR